MGLLTVKDVASELNVTEQSVRRWIKQGKLQRIKLSKSIRIAPEELQRFIKEGQIPY